MNFATPSIDCICARNYSYERKTFVYRRDQIDYNYIREIIEIFISRCINVNSIDILCIIVENHPLVEYTHKPEVFSSLVCRLFLTGSALMRPYTLYIRARASITQSPAFYGNSIQRQSVHRIIITLRLCL